jgi:hypothetical protein
MRKLLFVLCVLITKNTLAQLPLPCTFYTNSNSAQFSSFSGYKETPCLTFDFWQGDFGLADDNFRFYSTEIGEVHQNFSFDASNGGELHISSGNVISNLEGAWIYPTENYIVPMYTKVEWGVAFPNEVQAAINNWIINSNTGLTFSPALNPFDPEQIDIWAEVTHNGVTERVNGFYYIPYERGDDPSIDPNYWDWIPQTNLYNFRFRYTPIEIAEHAVKIRAVVTGFGEFELPFFEFQSAWNAVKDGFIKVSQNNHYLAYNDGSLFFPVGMNITAGSWNCKCDAGGDTDDCETCYVDGSNDPCCGLDFPYRQDGYNGDNDQQLGSEVKELCLPLASYKKLDLVMQKYIESGANAFKFILNPVYCDIEYERVNNYYDRMHQAWELDKLINTAEQNDLKMQFNMQLQTTWQLNANGGSNWDWSNTSDYQGDPVWEGNRGNCYWHDLGLDALNPYEFFTSEEARKQYKKKIRYIVARWGYTPNIYLWEIFSEINGVGGGDTFPYEDNPNEGIQGEFDGSDTKGSGIALPLPYDTDYTTKRQIISEWTNEIFSYLTYDLGVRQLMTCSYAGTAPLTLGENNTVETATTQGNLATRDQTWENPLCDAFCWSEYNMTLDRIAGFTSHYGKKHFLPGVSSFSGLNKPLLPGESGIYLLMDCDHTAYIKDLLTIPFSGYASAGMSWDEQNSSEYWLWMGRVRSILETRFLDNNNIGAESWYPKHQYLKANPAGLAGPGDDSDESSNSKVEFSFLANDEDNYTQVFGILINRTWNWWNNNTGEGNCVADSYLDDPTKAFIDQSFEEISTEDYNIRVKDFDPFKRYKIIYIDPISNENIDTKWDISSGSGKLNLQGCPDLSWDRPFFYIKIFYDPIGDNDESFFLTESNVLTASESFANKSKEQDIVIPRLNVYPNPNSGVFSIQSESSLGQITIFNQFGEIVFELKTDKSIIDIGMSSFSSGLYSITAGLGRKTRFIIQ